MFISIITILGSKNVFNPDEKDNLTGDENSSDHNTTIITTPCITEKDEESEDPPEHLDLDACARYADLHSDMGLKYPSTPNIMLWKVGRKPLAEFTIPPVVFSHEKPKPEPQTSSSSPKIKDEKPRYIDYDEFASADYDSYSSEEDKYIPMPPDFKMTYVDGHIVWKRKSPKKIIITEEELQEWDEEEKKRRKFEEEKREFEEAIKYEIFEESECFKKIEETEKKEELKEKEEFKEKGCSEEKESSEKSSSSSSIPLSSSSSDSLSKHDNSSEDNGGGANAGGGNSGDYSGVDYSVGSEMHFIESTSAEGSPKKPDKNGNDTKIFEEVINITLKSANRALKENIKKEIKKGLVKNTNKALTKNVNKVAIKEAEKAIGKSIAKGSGKAGLSVLKGVAPIAAHAIDIFEISSSIHDVFTSNDEEKKNPINIVKTLDRLAIENTISIAGGAIGTSIFPGVGTFLGSAVGGIAGTFISHIIGL